MTSCLCQCSTNSGPSAAKEEQLNQTSLPTVLSPSHTYIPPPLLQLSPVSCTCPCARNNVEYAAGMYSGCVDEASGRRHCTRGIMRYSNGNVYCGPWVAGAPDTTATQSANSDKSGVNTGTKWFRGGDVFVGGWKNGARFGQGIYTFAVASCTPPAPVADHQKQHPTNHSSLVIKGQYKGPYVDDQPHGHGIMVTYTTSPPSPQTTTSAIPPPPPIIKSVFEGRFSMGLKEGVGKVSMYNRSGEVVQSVVDGMWFRGKQIPESNTTTTSSATVTTTSALSNSSDGTDRSVRTGAAQQERPMQAMAPFNPVAASGMPLPLPVLNDSQFAGLTMALDGMGARMAALETRLASTKVKQNELE